MKKFAEQMTLFKKFHQDASTRRYTLLSRDETAYLELMGKLPPENRYNDAQWPVGPVKAKRRAKELVDGSG